MLLIGILTSGELTVTSGRIRPCMSFCKYRYMYIGMYLYKSLGKCLGRCTGILYGTSLRMRHSMCRGIP